MDNKNINNSIQSAIGGMASGGKPIIHTMDDDLSEFSGGAPMSAMVAEENIPINKGAIISEKVEERAPLEVGVIAERKLAPSTPAPVQSVPVQRIVTGAPEMAIPVERKPQVGVAPRDEKGSFKDLMAGYQKEKAPMETRRVEAQRPMPSTEKREAFGGVTQGKQEIFAKPPMGGAGFAAGVPQFEVAPVPAEEMKSEERNIPFGKIFGVVIVLIILAGGAFGGYYLYGLSKEVETAKPEEVVAPVVEEKEDEIPAYSLTMPNYLVINTETETKETFFTKFKDIFTKLPSEAEPFEFVASNENYFQIDYTVFADLVGLDFGPEITMGLGNEFSLFAYKDQGNDRLGIAVAIKPEKKDEFANILKKNENYLLGVAKFFSLDAYSMDSTKVFADSMYDDIAIRYTNLDEISNFSVDYAIVGDHFVLGTSKNSMRVIVDKVKAIDVRSATDITRTESKDIFNGDTGAETQNTGTAQ